jgi:hypothetical protein
MPSVGAALILTQQREHFLRALVHALSRVLPSFVAALGAFIYVHLHPQGISWH